MAAAARKTFELKYAQKSSEELKDAQEQILNKLLEMEQTVENFREDFNFKRLELENDYLNERLYTQSEKDLKEAEADLHSKVSDFNDYLTESIEKAKGAEEEYRMSSAVVTSTDGVATAYAATGAVLMLFPLTAPVGGALLTSSMVASTVSGATSLGHKWHFESAYGEITRNVQTKERALEGARRHYAECAQRARTAGELAQDVNDLVSWLKFGLRAADFFIADQARTARITAVMLKRTVDDKPWLAKAMKTFLQNGEYKRLELARALSGGIERRAAAAAVELPGAVRDAAKWSKLAARASTAVKVAGVVSIPFSVWSSFHEATTTGNNPATVLRVELEKRLKAHVEAWGKLVPMGEVVRVVQLQTPPGLGELHPIQLSPEAWASVRRLADEF